MPTGRRNKLRRAVMLLAASAASCGDAPPEVEKPTPPDMSALVRAYEMPEAALDSGTATEVAGQVGTVLDPLNSFGASQPLLAALESATRAYLDRGASGDAGLAASPAPPQAEGVGYLRVTRICDGWGASAVPDRAANGAIVGTVGFSESGPDPVAWGEFESCRYRLDTHLVLFDGGDAAPTGSFRIWLGQGLLFSEVGRKPAIIALDATGTVDGTPHAAHFDFRVDPASTSLEVRLATSKGDLVAVASGAAWLRAPATPDRA